MKPLAHISRYFLLVILAGCSYDFPEVTTPSAGQADFTKVIAIGNSLTAGYANGALYDEGQANSYAKIIASQLATITPAVFNQPDIDSPLGYSGTTPDGTPMGRLRLVNPENPYPAPVIPGDPFNDLYTGNKALLNNFGIPGIRLIDADIPGYANMNPYFKRFALDVDNSSQLSDALAANGSFFIFWLGNNDILGYALGGATGNSNGDGSNRDDLIDANLFSTKYANIINQLLGTGAKGVVANIPDVTDIPFFTTIPYDYLFFAEDNPADTLQVYTLNQYYASHNSKLEQAVTDGLISEEEALQRKIGFQTGSNAIVIDDEALTDLTGTGIAGIRQATVNDLITFKAASVLGQDLGNGTVGTVAPLADTYALTPEEQTVIRTRVEAFNNTINQVVTAANGNLALVDINSLFKEMASTGVAINGSALTATIFPPYGGFSLDGVHPNPRGAAFIANNFIMAINATFTANVPEVNPNNYPGNELPVPE